MKRQNRRINTEEVCIDSVVHRLREIDSSKIISARKESHDPPDFWLTVDGHEFPVEVTSIVVGEDQDYRGLYRKLAEEIQEAIDRDVKILGTYALSFHRKPAIPRRRTLPWNLLVTNCLKAIGSIADGPTLAEIAVHKDFDGTLTVVKTSQRGKNIGRIGPNDAKFEGEIRQELGTLLAGSIEEKRGKLAKRGIDPASAILALYDAYILAEIDDARQALADVESRAAFHSIFWASSLASRPNALYPQSPGRNGVFLFSKQVEWR